MQKALSFFVDESLAKQVKDYIDENGMTLKGYLTKLIKKDLERVKKENE